MSPRRRAWLLQWAGLVAPWAARAQPGRPPEPPPRPDPVRRGRPIVFPRDHGAHLAARTEWWYATGWLGASPAAPSHGVQVTFFRSRTGLAEGNPSRFAARQLLFAHAAITDLQGGRHLHDQRIARWSGDPAAVLGAASTVDGAVRLGPWWLRHDGAGWQASITAQGFTLELQGQRSQPPLLQGDAGYSRKGPQAAQASHYYSEPQLSTQATLQIGAEPAAKATGRTWLDHEWSDEILHPEAVGWDWIGINLLDGGALTAFVLRRADGSAVWAGGSHRGRDGPARVFEADAVRFNPGRRWRSPATGARYPVQWEIATPAGRHTVRALLDGQELDSRASVGTVYWEGLSELLDASGTRVGLGYLEMTGYAARLRLG